MPSDDLRRVPLWIIHGAEDQHVSISQSKEVVNNMHTFGVTPLLYYDWLFSHSLEDRRISEPFPLDNGIMKSAYRNWKSEVKVIISDPPRKDFLPVRQSRIIPDSLMLPPVDFAFDEYFD